MIESEFLVGTPVEMLPKSPPTPSVSLLYLRNRQLSPRVHVFIDWLTRAFSERRT